MKIDRLNEIEHYVFLKGSASIEELASRFDISINTVRRDIKELLKRGSVQKVYGGVTSTLPQNIVPISHNSQINTDAKTIIAEKAADLVDDNSTIYLDTGSTVCAIVPYLADKKDITIVTNSLSVIEAAAPYHFNLFSLGGFFNDIVSGFVGISAEENLTRLAFDHAFLGTTGISLDQGLTINGYYEEPIKRQVIQCCRKKIILMADHTKFNQHALLHFGRVEDLKAIVTDRKPPAEYVTFCKKNSIDLIF